LLPDVKMEGSMIFIAEPSLQFTLNLDKSQYDEEVNDDVFLEELLLATWRTSFKPLTLRGLTYTRLSKSYGDKFRDLQAQNKIRNEMVLCIIYCQLLVVTREYDLAEKALATMEKEVDDNAVTKKPFDEFEYKKYKYNINLWQGWLSLLKATNNSGLSRILSKRKGDGYLQECEKFSTDFSLLRVVLSILLEVNSLAGGVVNKAASRALEIKNKSLHMENFALFLKYIVFLDYGDDDEQKIGEKGLDDLSKMDSIKYLAGIKLCSFYKSKSDWENMARVAAEVAKRSAGRQALDRSQVE
jgi:hypothetical protein